MRLTLREASEALGKSRHWVYANCYAIGVRPSDWLLGAGELAGLVRRSFLSKSYESYPYELLATGRSGARSPGSWGIEATSIREAWGRHVASTEDACEFIFALVRLAPGTSVGNHVAYVHRAVGNDFSFRERLKGYAFAKLAGMFLRGRAGAEDLGLLRPGALPSGGMEEFKKGLAELLKNNIS